MSAPKILALGSNPRREEFESALLACLAMAMAASTVLRLCYPSQRIHVLSHV